MNKFMDAEKLHRIRHDSWSERNRPSSFRYNHNAEPEHVKYEFGDIEQQILNDLDEAGFIILPKNPDEATSKLQRCARYYFAIIYNSIITSAEK
jgi:hypothetical protein